VHQQRCDACNLQLELAHCCAHLNSCALCQCKQVRYFQAWIEPLHPSDLQEEADEGALLGGKDATGMRGFEGTDDDGEWGDWGPTPSSTATATAAPHGGGIHAQLRQSRQRRHRRRSLEGSAGGHRGRAAHGMPYSVSKDDSSIGLSSDDISSLLNAQVRQIDRKIQICLTSLAIT
jgi:hypothetical protein